VWWLSQWQATAKPIAPIIQTTCAPLTMAVALPAWQREKSRENKNGGTISSVHFLLFPNR
jgi:hypothetical protein